MHIVTLRAWAGHDGAVYTSNKRFPGEHPVMLGSRGTCSGKYYNGPDLVSESIPESAEGDTPLTDSFFFFF